MSFTTVTVGQIFSVGTGRSTQEDGKSQFALSAGFKARNANRQGQNNNQLTTTPNKIQARLTADRPRLNGHVDILAIDGVGSDADSDSFEGQGLQQEALGGLPNLPYGFSTSSTHGMGANKGEQVQRSRQGSDADNHVTAAQDAKTAARTLSGADARSSLFESQSNDQDVDSANAVNMRINDRLNFFQSAIAHDYNSASSASNLQDQTASQKSESVWRGAASNRAEQGQWNGQTANSGNWLNVSL